MRACERAGGAGSSIDIVENGTDIGDAAVVHCARTLEEAILWHGGEAANAVAKYKAMSVGETEALIKFLNSL